MSEKNITSLNQLKNWFKTGLKPTQAQFWAWLDSFYHKEEQIPQEKITGLAETLENKADNSAVEVKANADATGLSEEQKQAWKEALGVYQLPKLPQDNDNKTYILKADGSVMELKDMVSGNFD